MGHKISKEQIDPGVKDHIMSFVGNITELETDEKSDIISAVNSLMVDRVDNAENMGKLANAIGEPVTANHSVDEVVEGLGEMLSTFKTNMMNSGVMVESSDKFKQLIDKIKGLTEGEGNKGIQFAEGVVDCSGLTYINLTNPYTVNINLSFVPTHIFACIPDSRTNLQNDDYDNNYVYISNVSNYICQDYKMTINNISKDSFDIVGTVSISGSNVLIYTLGSNIQWYAIGIGEEDTTLRDSLASILENKGLDVTEEDDMASLISKVDSEFSKDNNAKDRLYNLMVEGGYEVNSSMSLESMLGLLELSGISISDVKQIVCGWHDTFVIKNDGTLWACGYNYYGELGLGDKSRRTTFTQVPDVTDVKQVTASQYHTLILKNDGSVWGAGYNNYGQLGLNDINDRYVFTNINSNAKQVACASRQTFILKNDGSLWACGYKYYGSLGIGVSENTKQLTFIKVTTNVSNVACGDDCTFIVKNDGSLWSCGRNDHGQLGFGTTSTSTTNTFTQVPNMTDVKQVICGSGALVSSNHNTHVFIIKNDGSVWSCGYNGYGQLGLGDATDRSTFTQVTTNINNDVRQIACGHYFTFIIKNNGTLWACGYNGDGQLGLGASDTNIHNTFDIISNNVDNLMVSCGYSYTSILKNNGSLWSCGINERGQLGLGDIDSRTTFTQVTTNINNVKF